MKLSLSICSGLLATIAGLGWFVGSALGAVLMFVLAVTAIGFAVAGRQSTPNKLFGSLVFLFACLVFATSIAAIALNLHARETSMSLLTNEAAAAKTLRALHKTEIEFARQNHRFASELRELDHEQLMEALDPTERSLARQALSDGQATGYQFMYTTGGQSFRISASPQQVRVTGVHFFLIDEHGKLHYNTMKPATADSPIIN
jgi:hypothetical protein